MNLKKYILPFSLLMLVSLSVCGPKNPAAAEQREKWLLSLNDSISKYQKDIELVGDSLDAARESVGRLVGAFDYVNNPREVEGYYILNGWKAKYPLSSTSMVARINESEGFELIAALSGGFFNEIAVSAGPTTRPLITGSGTSTLSVSPEEKQTPSGSLSPLMKPRQSPSLFSTENARAPCRFPRPKKI